MKQEKKGDSQFLLIVGVYYLFLLMESRIKRMIATVQDLINNFGQPLATKIITDNVRPLGLAVYMGLT